MTRLKLLSAGLVAAAALLTTPVMAQEATQEPGVTGFNYPDSHYLKGGYGHRFSPGPGFYYRHQFVGPGAMVEVPAGAYGYGYYVGPESEGVWIGD